jgi:hypothetical protein
MQVGQKTLCKQVGQKQLSIIAAMWHIFCISFYKFIERNQIRAQADSVAHHFCDVEYHFGDLASPVDFFYLIVE